MDYNDISRIMSSHSFPAESAFRDVTISISPIPDMDGCPLGLYYPGSGTIVIPPDGYKSVVYHELGHRYGHYHFGDLSEEFAERWRERYQPGRVVMYAGGDFRRLPAMGRLFTEGQHGDIQVAFQKPLSPDQLSSLTERLYQQSRGERIPRVYYTDDPNTIGLGFTMGIDWLAITAGVLAGAAVLGVGAIAYAIYKTAKQNPWVVPMVIVGALATGALIKAAVAEKRQAEIRR